MAVVWGNRGETFLLMMATANRIAPLMTSESASSAKRSRLTFTHRRNEKLRRTGYNPRTDPRVIAVARHLDIRKMSRPSMRLANVCTAGYRADQRGAPLRAGRREKRSRDRSFTQLRP